MLREFTDSAGIAWRVWDTRPTTAAVRDAYLDGWLTFEQQAPLGRAPRKRLVPIPDGWEDLREDDLRRLCLKAKAETPRPRLNE